MRTTGQALTESILLMPLFFLFFFGLLQVAQLGIAVVMTSYAASSIARIAAASGNVSAASSGPVSSISQYQSNAQKFMVAGASLKDLSACVQATPPTATLTVRVRAKVDAYPFFAQVLSGALSNAYADESGGTCPNLANPNGFGPFNFSNNGAYYFYVSGIASTRLNYAP